MWLNFITGWSPVIEARSVHRSRGSSPFGAILFLLMLVALGSTVVHAEPFAQETACPAPDTNGSNLITEYTIPTANSQPSGITMGPDGALWYGPANGKNIGRISTDGIFTEFPFPLAHDGDQRFFAAGPDGAVWFTDDWQNQIGRITSDGGITEYPIPSGIEDTDDNGIAYTTSLPRGLVTGADGALWFTEAYGNNIGRITVDGIITEYPIPTADSNPVGLALGSDGAVWFIEKNANQIGQITTEGVITEYPVPTPESSLLRIAAGSDGALWFSEFAGNNIGRITTDGVITEYPLPPCANPVGITAGSDGAIWFTEYNGNKIGRISMEGQITEYTIPTPESVPFSIVAGSDGALWFTENAGGKIGRLDIQTALTTFSSDVFALPMSVSFGAEWHVTDNFSDLLTLMNDRLGVDTAFIIVTDATRIADPTASFSTVPFPSDFVGWIQSHGLFPVVETQPVVVGGFQGTEIRANATTDCGTKQNWLFLAETGWNCRQGENYRFIDLEDVNGERVIIMNTGGDNLSTEHFQTALAAVQPILDSIVFTPIATIAPIQTQRE